MQQNKTLPATLAVASIGKWKPATGATNKQANGQANKQTNEQTNKHANKSTPTRHTHAHNERADLRHAAAARTFLERSLRGVRLASLGQVSGEC